MPAPKQAPPKQARPPPKRPSPTTVAQNTEAMKFNRRAFGQDDVPLKHELFAGVEQLSRQGDDAQAEALLRRYMAAASPPSAAPSAIPTTRDGLEARARELLALRRARPNDAALDTELTTVMRHLNAIRTAEAVVTAVRTRAPPRTPTADREEQARMDACQTNLNAKIQRNSPVRRADCTDCPDQISHGPIPPRHGYFDGVHCWDVPNLESYWKSQPGKRGINPYTRERFAAQHISGMADVLRELRGVGHTGRKRKRPAEVPVQPRPYDLLGDAVRVQRAPKHAPPPVPAPQTSAERRKAERAARFAAQRAARNGVQVRAPERTPPNVVQPPAAPATGPVGVLGRRVNKAARGTRR